MNTNKLRFIGTAIYFSVKVGAGDRDFGFWSKFGLQLYFLLVEFFLTLISEDLAHLLSL